MENKTEKTTCYQITSKILYQISSLKSLGTGSQYKAILANLRNSIGRPISQSIDVWRIMYEYLPEDFLGSTSKMTYEEISILNTLQLYALYMQAGQEKNEQKQELSNFDNMGYSLRVLRQSDNHISMDRRFNIMITATSYDEFIHHLRQMIKLLKKYPTTDINFPLLSQDLYSFLLGYGEDIRIKWSRKYYSNNKNNEKGELSDEK